MGKNSDIKKAEKKIDVKGPGLLGPPVILFVLLAVALMTTAFVYTVPTTTETPEPRPYSVEYDFGYDAALPPNPVYQSDRLVYGQPIFLNIVDNINVDVTYKVQNPNAQVDNGELVMQTVLIGSAGWTRQLGEPVRVPFTGLEVSGVIPVDFAAAIAAGKENDAITGTTSTLNVRVVAETYVQGRLLQNGKGPGQLAENTLSDVVFSLKSNYASIMLPKDPAAPNTPSPTAGIAPGTAGASSETGYSSTETGYSSTESGYLSVEAGYLSVDSGYASTESGYLSEETGYLSSEPGLASSEPGQASSEPGLASSTPGQASSAPGTASSTSSEGAAPRTNPSRRDPSVKTITQMVPTDVKTQNSISVLGFFEFPVEIARTVFAGASILLLLLSIYNIIVMTTTKRKGPIAVLLMRHGSRIIPMSTINISHVKDVVEVDSFDALHAVSLETEQLIMMKIYSENAADFYVADNGSNYRFHLDAANDGNEHKNSEHKNSEDKLQMGESNKNDGMLEHDGPTSEV